MHVLDSIQIKDGSGFGNLDKIWRAYEVQLAELLPSKILLLYDCDTNKPTAKKGQLIKRVIPLVADSEIKSGIENLIPATRIQRLEVTHPRFIDVCQSTVTRTRGIDVTMPTKKSVNRDEKNNLCEWLCENGTAEDFCNFTSVFDIIECELLDSSSVG